MSNLNARQRLRLISPSPDNPLATLADAVRAGLTARPKQLPCRFFYDAQGSALFEEICSVPEYYLPRAERQILESHAQEIVELFDGRFTLVELGCGNAVKTRLLIQAAWAKRDRLLYIPVDISPAMLEKTCLALLGDFPGLEILAVAGDYEAGLACLKIACEGPKLILWLGSNIGNFDRAEAEAFLARVRQSMTPADRFLVGIDLRKAPSILEAAYDDAAGVTARFNLNILGRINRELDGHFDLGAFQHRAVYNDEIGRIEMYLVSRSRQPVGIAKLGLEISFDAGETIHTENSYKYSPDEIAALAAASGFTVGPQWFDAQHLFCTTIFKPQ